jgi:hypothetical protein
MTEMSDCVGRKVLKLDYSFMVVGCSVAQSFDDNEEVSNTSKVQFS